MSRATCPDRERCGATGHYWNEKTWVRCPCLQLEINRRKLGAFYCDKPEAKSPLSPMTGQNLVIEGPLESIRKHGARALLDLLGRDQTFLIMDAYRLIEIYLEKDDEMTNQTPALDADLLIMLLAFGDPRNRMLPELVLQVINRRDMLQKPTWMVLGIDLEMVGSKYNQDLQDRLKKFQKVRAK